MRLVPALGLVCRQGRLFVELSRRESPSFLPFSGLSHWVPCVKKTDAFDTDLVPSREVVFLEVR